MCGHTVTGSPSLSRCGTPSHFDLDNWQSYVLYGIIIENWSLYEEEPDEFFEHQKEKDTRLSRADGHPRRQAGAEPQKGEGQKKTDCLISTEAKRCTGYLMALANRERHFLRREDRIRKRAEYKSIYEQGTRTHSRNFIIISQKNSLGYGRIGITLSKKAGNSVRRNRIKRMVREFFRLNKNRLAASQDIVVIGKKGIPRLSYREVCAELEGLAANKASE